MKILELKVNDKNKIEFIVKTHLQMPIIWSDSYMFEEKEISENITKFKSDLLNNNAKCYYFYDDSKVLSFIWFSIEPSFPETIKIISMWTHENYRKQGLSTRLKVKLENWAIENGYKRIQTSVSHKNPNMIKLNEKLGYNKTFIMMEKILK